MHKTATTGYRYECGLAATIEALSGDTCRVCSLSPPKSRVPYESVNEFHALMCAGTFVGDVTALARVSFGIDMGRNVAMKLVTRSEALAVSEAIHQIIQS